MEQGKEIRVEWIDATHAESSSKSRALKFKPSPQVSRGELINETDEFITIAGTTSLDRDDDEDEHYRDVLCIPKQMVTARKVLKEEVN